MSVRPRADARRRRLRGWQLAAIACVTAACSLAGPRAAGPRPPAGTYQDLVVLFEDWRDFERPPLRDGAPDYTAERMARAHAQLPGFLARLRALDRTGWSLEQQVDWHVVLAELNGFDFN